MDELPNLYNHVDKDLTRVHGSYKHEIERKQLIDQLIKFIQKIPEWNDASNRCDARLITFLYDIAHNAINKEYENLKKKEIVIAAMKKAYTLNVNEENTVSHIIDFLCEQRIPHRTWLIEKLWKFAKKWLMNFFLN